MVDGMWTVLGATLTLIAAYATAWLVRHELAVRRFRAQTELTGSVDRR